MPGTWLKSFNSFLVWKTRKKSLSRIEISSPNQGPAWIGGLLQQRGEWRPLQGVFYLQVLGKGLSTVESNQHWVVNKPRGENKKEPLKSPHMYQSKGGIDQFRIIGGQKIPKGQTRQKN